MVGWTFLSALLICPAGQLPNTPTDKNVCPTAGLGGEGHRAAMSDIHIVAVRLSVRQARLMAINGWSAGGPIPVHRARTSVFLLVCLPRYDVEYTTYDENQTWDRSV
ncbi:MAG: hypothetical protein OJF49_004057 [Ktedonobacterales bacterium]|nr:MAG: hypothetical protein OJF49_004057 [Ktedonobacterales bacterium]